MDTTCGTTLTVLVQLFMTHDQACNYCLSAIVRIIGNHQMRTKLPRLRTKVQQTQQRQRRRNLLKSLNSPSPRKNQGEEPKSVLMASPHQVVATPPSPRTKRRTKCRSPGGIPLTAHIFSRWQRYKCPSSLSRSF